MILQNINGKGYRMKLWKYVLKKIIIRDIMTILQGFKEFKEVNSKINTDLRL